MISNLYKILLFLIPLVFYKNTSEVFEFNKLIVLYIITILIMARWSYGCIVNKKIIFRRTILDWPLVAFLSFLIISYLFSIDQRTSLLGYYSRFNGGLSSVFCFALLYWAFVSNLTQAERLRVTRYGLIGTAIASILAILEHYNIGVTCGLMGLGWNTSCWVQDVQNRVYSTFGQPNWLAATLVALMPLAWLQMLNMGSTQGRKKLNAKLNLKYLAFAFLAFIFFITLLFTKSRSGFLAFGIESVIFWGLVFWKRKLKYLRPFLIINSIYLILFLIFSPLSTTHKRPSTISNAPALETGGTESGQIRKIVWQGAIEIWKHNPLLGTGPETFAFAYPMFKPLEQNLTSEWDFIYNKAHNEYLNYLATTGILGLFSYLGVIAFSIIQILKNSNSKHEVLNSKQFRNSNLKNYNFFRISDFGFRFSLLAGYCGLLITNFFGFSVVYTSLLFFLFPAIALIDEPETKVPQVKTKFSFYHWLSIVCILITTYYILHTTIRYWLADIHYNKGKIANRSDDVILARQNLEIAIGLNSKEAVYYSEVSSIDAEIASVLDQETESEKAKEFVEYTIYASDKAIQLSPYNLSIKKNFVSTLSKLSKFNQNYLDDAIEVMQDAIEIAPTDPKLYYQLGLLYLKIGQVEHAVVSLEKSVELKPNYKEGRFALGVVYKDLEMFNEAKRQFDYILEKIDPNDPTTKKYLEELN